jgi:hypothetical protein
MRYDAFEIKKGAVLRIYNESNSNYNEIKKNSFTTEIVNNAFNDGTESITFKTKSNTSTLVNNVVIQYNKTTVNQIMYCNGGLYLPSSPALTFNSSAALNTPAYSIFVDDDNLYIRNGKDTDKSIHFDYAKELVYYAFFKMNRFENYSYVPLKVAGNITLTTNNSYIQFPDSTQQSSAFTGAGTLLAGSYTNTSLTLDSNGKITKIESGASGGTPTLEQVLGKDNKSGNYSIYMTATKPIYFGTAYINANGADLEIVNYTTNATISLYTANGIFARLNSSGQFTALSFNVPSDYRIKENIEPLNETINVDNLKPVKYFNKQTKREDMGLVAHELQEVFPFLVNGEKDGKDYQSVNYNGLIPVLIKEIQDLKQEIKSLKNLFLKKID